MRLRYASPYRALPEIKFSVVGIGDNIHKYQSESNDCSHSANGVQTSTGKSIDNRTPDRDYVTQFTSSKNEYSANRVPQEWVSPHDVADKRRITNITKNNTCVTFESTAKNASANSAYRSIAKENIGSQEERTIQGNKNSSVFYEQAIKDTVAKLAVMFPEQATNNRIIEEKIAIEGYKLADNVYTAKDAEEWGNNYKVPDSLVRSDEALFKASMRDIKVMAEKRQKKLKGNRLNVDRVQLHTRADNPERSKLFLLAEKGMPLLRREGFKANGQGKLPTLRKTYISVQSTSDWHSYSLNQPRCRYPTFTSRRCIGQRSRAKDKDARLGIVQMGDPS